jgi:hypothetical protein
MATMPSNAYLLSLIGMLAGTLPTTIPFEQRRAMVTSAFEAFEARDIVEAMLAIRMIASMHATLDSYQRAQSPDPADTAVTRMRANAVAAARSFDTAQRAFEKRRAPVEAPPRKPAKPATPAAAPEEPIFTPNAKPYQNPNYTPRDKHGQEIAFWRNDDMTMAQRRAAYGEPDDFEAQAIARAEEDKAIEEERQRAAAEPQPATPRDRGQQQKEA